MKKLCFIGLLMAIGCSSKYEPTAAPKTTPVNGKITLANGSPLTGGRVIFKPKDKGMQEALAEIDKDGSYKLSSYNKGDGAAPGEYVVVIEKLSYKNGAPTNVRADVPQKYLNEASSDVIVTVKEGQTDYPIRLK